MPTCATQNATLFYEDQGSGPAIVFTHGHSLHHGQWAPQVAALSSRYRTITWDVRGHGQSSLPPGTVDPEDFSRDLVRLMDARGLESAILCGLSMGGHISLQTAVRRPERVKGLILIGTPFTNAFDAFDRLAVPFNRGFIRLLPLRLTARLTADLLSRINPANRQLIEESFETMPRDHFIRHWDGNLRMESRADLGKVMCPTLILHGEHDSMVRRQQAYLAANIRGAELHTIPNAHHLTNLDNPEAVTTHIERFMERWR
jgi:3-oxoadipate enol-lactonase